MRCNGPALAVNKSHTIVQMIIRINLTIKTTPYSYLWAIFLSKLKLWDLDNISKIDEIISG